MLLVARRLGNFPIQVVKHETAACMRQLPQRLRACNSADINSQLNGHKAGQSSKHLYNDGARAPQGRRRRGKHQEWCCNFSELRWKDTVRSMRLLQRDRPHRLTIRQIPQACLVTSWRLVLSANQLEGQHSRDWRHHHWNYRNGLERERRSGTQNEDARIGTVLPKQIVRIELWHTGSSRYATCGNTDVIKLEQRDQGTRARTIERRIDV